MLTSMLARNQSGLFWTLGALLRRLPLGRQPLPAAQGAGAAAKNRDRVAAKMTPEQIAEALGQPGWIDRPLDTQGCTPCFHVLLSAAWKRSHAQRPVIWLLRH
jgi:hypothetical protein